MAEFHMLEIVVEELEGLLKFLKESTTQVQEGAKMHLVLERQKEILERQFKKFERGVTGWMFGYRINPVTHLPQHHNGIDLPEETGAKVLCPWSGDVIAAWCDIDGDNINGYAVKIRHAGAPVDETAYAHLTHFADGIGKGAKVKAGQVIGYVGETGRTLGAHLHFITRRYVNGKRTDVDPLPLLAAACGLAEIPVHEVG